jgi:hypothetical protein
MRPPASIILFDFGASAAETVAIARTVKVMLSNHTHPNLKEPWPPWITSLEALGQGADMLETALQRAVNRDILMVQERDAKQLGVKKDLCTIARFVELAVDGDRAAVKAAGFSLRPQSKAKSPMELPPAPIFTVSHGDDEGTANGKAPSDRRAKSFRVQVTEGDPADEAGYRVVEDFPLASKMIIRGLEPGKLYWFRASILSSAGRGPWSKPVSLRIL